MAKDIEEFLKMAAQRRREAAARGNPAPEPAPQVPPAQPPRQGSKKSRQPPVLLEAEDVAIVPPRRESVSKHVQQHVNTGRIKKRIERLGAEVGQADEKLEAHLHDVFDHQIGKLRRPSIAADDSVAQVKSSTRRSRGGLPSLLSTPQNLRQAIILSEILQRPDWDRDV